MTQQSIKEVTFKGDKTIEITPNVNLVPGVNLFIPSIFNSLQTSARYTKLVNDGMIEVRDLTSQETKEKKTV